MLKLWCNSQPMTKCTNNAHVVDRKEGFLNKRSVNKGNVDATGFSRYIAVTLYDFTYV